MAIRITQSLPSGPTSIPQWSGGGGGGGGYNIGSDIGAGMSNLGAGLGQGIIAAATMRAQQQMQAQQVAAQQAMQSQQLDYLKGKDQLMMDFAESQSELGVFGKIVDNFNARDNAFDAHEFAMHDLGVTNVLEGNKAARANEMVMLGQQNDQKKLEALGKYDSLIGSFKELPRITGATVDPQSLELTGTTGVHDWMQRMYSNNLSTFAGINTAETATEAANKTKGQFADLLRQRVQAIKSSDLPEKDKNGLISHTYRFAQAILNDPNVQDVKVAGMDAKFNIRQGGSLKEKLNNTVEEVFKDLPKNSPFSALSLHASITNDVLKNLPTTLSADQLDKIHAGTSDLAKEMQTITSTGMRPRMSDEQMLKSLTEAAGMFHDPKRKARMEAYAKAFVAGRRPQMGDIGLRSGTSAPTAITPEFPFDASAEPMSQPMSGPIPPEVKAAIINSIISRPRNTVTLGSGQPLTSQPAFNMSAFPKWGSQGY